jgi:DNA invertase Pin-like site-specific DNA recombinase
MKGGHYREVSAILGGVDTLEAKNSVEWSGTVGRHRNMGVSGVNTRLADRPEGKRLFDMLRTGDVLVVRWVDRPSEIKSTRRSSNR